MLRAAMETLHSPPPIETAPRLERTSALFSTIAGIAVSIGAVFADEPEQIPKSVTHKTPETLRADIQKLGAEDFKTRQKAHTALQIYLKDTGHLEALRIVATASRDPADLERKRRAQQIRDDAFGEIFAKTFEPRKYESIWMTPPKDCAVLPWMCSLNRADFTVPDFWQRESWEEVTPYAVSQKYLGKCYRDAIQWDVISSWQYSRSAFQMFKEDLTNGYLREYYDREDFEEKKVPEIRKIVLEIQERMTDVDEEYRRFNDQPSMRKVKPATK